MDDDTLLEVQHLVSIVVVRVLYVVTTQEMLHRVVNHHLQVSTLFETLCTVNIKLS